MSNHRLFLQSLAPVKQATVENNHNSHQQAVSYDDIDDDDVHMNADDDFEDSSMRLKDGKASSLSSTCLSYYALMKSVNSVRKQQKA
jgi:hypothetical protein